jgi:polyphenol oxidase
MRLITPDWPAPAAVRAAMTTRVGGVSAAPYDGLNLGYATADHRNAVMENERRTAAALGITEVDIRWVHQVHGVDVHAAESLPANEPLGSTVIRGDAVVSHTPGLVCAVKVADCMPLLLAARDGSAVGAAHAGWRGLAGGVLERTVAALRVDPRHLVAWMGPCIGPTAFEVGEDVRAAFVAHDANAARHFVARAAAGKYLCDLYAIAKDRLRAVGVTDVSGGDHCTFNQPDVFFSHRRDAATGRMAALIWIER